MRESKQEGFYLKKKSQWQEKEWHLINKTTLNIPLKESFFYSTFTKIKEFRSYISVIFSNKVDKNKVK